MAVYVDPLKNYGAGDEAPRCFRNVESCHMYADTLDELHTMAIRIGMRKSWFQNHQMLPHYDLVKSRRKLAVNAGVVEHSFREMVEFSRKIRNDRSTTL